MPFRCDFHGREFATISAKRQHVRDTHPACGMCKCRRPTLLELTEHLLVAHGIGHTGPPSRRYHSVRSSGRPSNHLNVMNNQHYHTTSHQPVQPCLKTEPSSNAVPAVCQCPRPDCLAHEGEYKDGDPSEYPDSPWQDLPPYSAIVDTVPCAEEISGLSDAPGLRPSSEHDPHEEVNNAPDELSSEPSYEVRIDSFGPQDEVDMAPLDWPLVEENRLAVTSLDQIKRTAVMDVPRRIRSPAIISPSITLPMVLQPESDTPMSSIPSSPALKEDILSQAELALMRASLQSAMTVSDIPLPTFRRPLPIPIKPAAALPLMDQPAYSPAIPSPWQAQRAITWRNGGSDVGSSTPSKAESSQTSASLPERKSSEPRQKPLLRVLALSERGPSDALQSAISIRMDTPSRNLPLLTVSPTESFRNLSLMEDSPTDDLSVIANNSDSRLGSPSNSLLGLSDTHNDHTTRGIDALEPELSALHCRRCKRDPCKDIAATMCGHIFCHNCIVEAIVATSRCPVCHSLSMLNCVFRLHL